VRTGIVVAARPGVEDLAVRAEELGFSSFWVYDTPMVHGDPFVALALCAKVTSRIKLGIGVVQGVRPFLRAGRPGDRRPDCRGGDAGYPDRGRDGRGEQEPAGDGTQCLLLWGGDGGEHVGAGGASGGPGGGEYRDGDHPE
jgi:hypothetical protein